MTVYERLDKFNKSDLLELLTSSIKTLSEKEALLLSDKPNLFWFEIYTENTAGNEFEVISVELQYKGNRYKGIFQIAN